MGHPDPSFLYNIISSTPVFQQWIQRLILETGDQMIIKTFSMIDYQTVKVIVRAYNERAKKPVVKTKTFTWTITVTEKNGAIALL